MKKYKTLYLWDLAGTLFYEEWNAEKSGFPACLDWVASQLGKKPDELTDREYEAGHEIPYKEGWYWNLDIQPGVKEVLEWTKNNETFSTGVPEQVDWRMEYLKPKIGFDVRDYMQKINSTFDYGETNTKTKEMLVDYMQKKYDEGYKIIVCTDDKEKNLDSFKEAAEEIKKNYPDFSCRLYLAANDNQGLREKDNYCIIGSLNDLFTKEKQL